MNKERGMINDNELMQELSLDELDEVAAGKISLKGYALLYAAILQWKALGKDKDHVLRAVTKGWNEDCEFKKFTDGTDMDLQSALNFVNHVW